MTHSPADLLVPLAHLSPSPTNPRTRMAASEIARLAESIAVHEVMQPILARPIIGAADGTPPLEIVAGHRRWSGCNLLAEQGRNPHGKCIPAVVRALTDAQVLAMQLVENIQREDLHPLDEAEHYRRMREDPAAPASVEDIAATGKVSPSRVYERLSLLHLVPAAREAFLADKLSLKTALQVARLPPAHQAEATQHLADWGGEPMPPKAAAAFIRQRFMLQLAQAPFPTGDETLVPEAGACGACGKRTGANPQLFGDISDADICTDTSCFSAKKAAQHARLMDELQVSGYQVLQGEAARAVCTPDGRDVKPGLHLLDSPVPHALGDPTLKVVDVLTRAQSPNGMTKVIDHPASPLVTYAVATVDLEQALRKIKAHRTQLDKAKPAPKAAAPAPAPAAPAPQAQAEGLDAMGQPLANWISTKPDEPAQGAGPSAELVEQLLAFKPPPTVAGRYHGMSHDAYAQQQTRRAMGILAAAQAARAMATDGGEDLPPHRLAHMVLMVLMWGDTYLSNHEACSLAGLELPADIKHLDETARWMWDLPKPDAERLCMVMLALQQTNGEDPLAPLATTVAEALSLDVGELEKAAHDSVTQCLHLAALEEGTAPGSKPRKSAAKAKGATA